MSGAAPKCARCTLAQWATIHERPHPFGHAFESDANEQTDIDPVETVLAQVGRALDCECSLCVAFRTPSSIEQRAKLVELATRVENDYCGGTREEQRAGDLASMVLDYLGVSR